MLSLLQQIFYMQKYQDKRYTALILAITMLIGWMNAGCVMMMGPEAMGDAGDELIYLTVGDKLALSSGKKVTVDADGFLRGIPDIELIAAGVKVRDVMKQLEQMHSFEQYRFIEYGKRSIEVAGAIPRSGKYVYPPGEDWSIMNLLMNIDAVNTAEAGDQYLLIRRAWAFPRAYTFLRGQILPQLGGMGGEDVLIQSGDLILFPGEAPPIYVFGAVPQPLCFTFVKESPATLETAIERAGGLASPDKTTFIQVYRVLDPENQTIFSLAWPHERNFTLQAWDVVFVP